MGILLLAMNQNLIEMQVIELILKVIGIVINPENGGN
jgi:hypothetical protein